MDLRTQDCCRSTKPTIARELVLDALLMALWRRKPQQRVVVHSDQGTQYGSDDCAKFCVANRLGPSMSRRGNCWDNAPPSQPSRRRQSGAFERVSA